MSLYNVLQLHEGPPSSYTQISINQILLYILIIKRTYLFEQEVDGGGPDVTYLEYY